jgi:peptidoglycan/LPS O-acetylase OafA/YrhL
LISSLSGFLITGILIETRDDRNRTRNFYIRRGLRIWPLYFAFLMIAAIGFRRMMPAQPHFWACALFIQNFLCLEGAGPVLQPTWSLAVEEQFYIVWPWLAFRLKPESILRLCCVLVAVSPLIRLAHLYVGASGFYVYSNTLTRLDSIAVGSALAAWVRTRNFDKERMKRLSKPAIYWCGAGAAIGLYFGERHWASESLKYSLVALTCGGIVALALSFQAEDHLYPRFFRQNWLRFLGKISFALYLFNYPIIVMVHGNHGAALANRLGLTAWNAQLFFAVIEFTLTIAAAWASWHILESRMLRLKTRLAPR